MRSWAGVAAIALVLSPACRTDPLSRAVAFATPSRDTADESVAPSFDSLVIEAMRAENIPGAVVVVVRGDRIIITKGYGVADLETRGLVTDSTIFRIGSISKVFTATAVVQLADRRRIDLSEDVNSYLKRIKVPATYARPITAWDLITHSAGLDEIRPGTQAERESEVLPLPEFLKGKLVRYERPGQIASYSTYAITLAGALIEDVSGMTFESYLRREIWDPLGMRHTSITVPAADRRLLAKGYDVEDGAVQPARWEWYHTTPASSVNSTALDMARFMSAHLGGGALGNARILSDSATREMHRQQTTVHPLIEGWGLGLQQAQSHGERLVQHGGDVAGYSSLMTLNPSQRLGIFVASHREGSNLRFVVRDALLDRFFPDSQKVSPPVPMHRSRERIERYAGRYRATIACHSCGAAARPSPEVTITVNDDGTLSMWGARWVEVSPRFFRSENGTRRIGFREDEHGRISHLTGGSWQVMEHIQ